MPKRVGTSYNRNAEATLPDVSCQIDARQGRKLSKIIDNRYTGEALRPAESLTTLIHKTMEFFATSKASRKTRAGLLAITLLSASAMAQAKSYIYYSYCPGIRPAVGATTSPPTTTYATLNPSDEASGGTTTLSNGNLTDTSSGGAGIRGTIGKSSGKWYYEVTVVALAGTVAPIIGIAGANNALLSGWAGPSLFSYWGYSNGQVIYSTDIRAAYGSNAAAGDVIGVAVDLDNRQMTFYRNGTSMGTAFTSTVLPAGTYYPFVTDPGNGLSTTVTANFGQKPFAYQPPAGYNSGWYQ